MDQVLGGAETDVLLIMVSSKYQHIVQVTEHPVIAYKDCTDTMLNVPWSTADAKC